MPGAAGVAVTVTLIVAGALPQPLLEITSEYAPAASVEADVITGFAMLEVNPLGPVQLYPAPLNVVVERLRFCAAHKGALLLSVGVAGIGRMLTDVVDAGLVQPL
jgi:hypothetical protein